MAKGNREAGTGKSPVGDVNGARNYSPDWLRESHPVPADGYRTSEWSDRYISSEELAPSVAMVQWHVSTAASSNSK